MKIIKEVHNTVTFYQLPTQDPYSALEIVFFFYVSTTHAVNN